MLNYINQLSSLRNGYLALEDSLGPNSKNTLGDARYVLLSPHDHANPKRDFLGINCIPDEVLTELDGLEQNRLTDYLESERDAGIDELRREILRRCNGGVSVSGQVNRGICNLNKETHSNPIPNIFTPELSLQVLRGRPTVERQLLGIHRIALADIDFILKGVQAGTPILCLHSMDPWSFAKGVRPALSPENFNAYVDAQGLKKGKISRVDDFITGQADGPNLADQVFYAALQTELDTNDIPWAYNQPYGTDSAYPDYRYMTTFPGQVSCVDLLKTRLCKGDYRTFDPRSPEVDPEKVAFMADLHRHALSSRLR